MTQKKGEKASSARTILPTRKKAETVLTFRGRASDAIKKTSAMKFKKGHQRVVNHRKDR